MTQHSDSSTPAPRPATPVDLAAAVRSSRDTRNAIDGPPWIGSVHHRAEIDLQWLTVAVSMLTLGIAFFGWRAAIVVLATALATLAGHGVMRLARRLIGKDPRVPHLHALNLGLLLGLGLPLLHDPLLPAMAGFVLGIIAHFVGRAHRLRAHPVAIVLVLVWLVPNLLVDWSLLEIRPRALERIDSVLRPGALVVGDARDMTAEVAIAPWWSPAEYEAPDAIRRRDAATLVLQQRENFLRDRDHLIHVISAGELVRLEEIFIGAHPDAIGASSRALLVFLGFYLMYRRLAFWQVAAAAFGAALAVLLVMPMTQEDGSMTMLVSKLVALGPAAAITYLAYFLFATPLVFCVMILAPGATPMSRLGRLIYGVLIGGGAVALMCAIAEPQAAYVALLTATILTRPLDALQRSAFVL